MRGISHIRISLDGIFSRVNQATLILSLFFLTIGILLITVIYSMLQRIILQPVLVIGQGVDEAAEGDLETVIPLEGQDELGRLAGQINQMIVGLKERNRLQIQNKVIETRLEESRKYLDNINEGLLLIDAKYAITHQYSTYLTRLFRREDLAGLPLLDFIYPKADKQQEERTALQDFLKMIFTNQTADMEMILSINPLDKARLKIDGNQIIVHADFQRIMEDGKIVNVMVIFEDLTSLEKTREELDRQKQQRASELEQIAAILRVGPSAFEGFIAEAWKAFRHLREETGRLDRTEVVAGLFREIHSVKGTARYLSYSRIEEITQRIEDILAEIRDNGLPADSSAKETISRHINELYLQMEGVEALVNRFKQFALPSTASAPRELELFRDRIEEMIAEIADDRQKKIRLDWQSEETELPELEALRPALLHLIRNSIDHGIEDPYERIASEKDETARLTLRITRTKELQQIDVEDDGQGIDWRKIKQRGVEKGMIDPSEKSATRLAGLLFKPGFSSKDTADDLSGRGVGLDAVAHTIKKLGGKVKLKTEKGRGTRFTLTYPLASEEATRA